MEQFYKLSVSVTGIKKRCRKTEFHLLQGGYIPYNDGTFDREAIEVIAKGLIETNIKKVEKEIFVILNHVKVTDGIQTWEMFGKTNERWKIVSSLENELN